ncbi:hypothetical protein [Marinicellulosiphila megalodicopiae]|uniref:hypothetical protein n=1 Tax=Marinicellulosiphila megalodicopiae TaxID=2724896 RepID=UPI003BB07B6F
MTKNKNILFFLLFISMKSFSFENQSPEKDQYLSGLIEPMFFINYDQVLDWGASVVFVPILFEEDFGFEPLAEMGLSKKGLSAGLGGRLGFKENGYSFTLYSMANMTNIWSENKYHDLELGWHFNPKLGLDFTCFNLEANQLINDEFKTDTYFSVKFRITETCAQALSLFLGGF